MPPNAKRDQNFVTTLMAVSNVDGVTPVLLYADPVTHRLLVSTTGGGSGDVVGPASATANAIARYNLTTGKLIKNSNVTISDTGAINVAGTFTLPIVDGTNGQVLTTNGAGVVSWGSVAGTGTVTSVSVVSANGFAGTVATATSTPAITLTTTINGYLQGNGTAISAAATSGANSLVVRDANQNTVINNLIEPLNTITSAAGTTILTIASNFQQYVVGSTTQTIQLPDATTLSVGFSFYINNRSTGLVTVTNASATTLFIMQSGTSQIFTVTDISTAAGNWIQNNGTVNAITGKKATFNNTLTIAGTDGTTMTFPTTSASIARTDAAQIFTGVQSMTSPAITTGITAVGATFDLVNTVSTTITFAGAATTLTVGGTPTTAITHNYSTNATATATTKTVNIATGGAAGSTTNVDIGSSTASAILGRISLNFPTIITGSNNTTVSLWDTLSTTITFAGSATTLTLGYNSTAASTTNISTGAVAAATTKTVNIATGGAASSTTNVNIGSANGGTTNIASPTLQSNGVAVPTISSTSTFTNKRVTQRTSALSANSATPSINTDTTDVVHITGQTAAITSFTTGLTGTPVDGDTLRISITGTAAVALTWGASFEASTVALPTTTVTTTRLDVGFFWNTETSKWRCVASA